MAITGTRLSIRLDLTTGDKIGPGKIAASWKRSGKPVRSPPAPARSECRIGARGFWSKQINLALQEPAVTSVTGGRQGGGAVVTAVGERIIKSYHAIEAAAHKYAAEEFRAVEKVVRKNKTQKLIA